MYRNKWKWILAVLALAVVAGREAVALRKKSDLVCRTAQDLAKNADALRVWLIEAEADPFLGESAMRGTVNSVMVEFRSRSKWIQSEFTSRLLQEQAQQAFFKLNSSSEQNGMLVSALAEVSALKSVIRCERPSLEPDEFELMRKIEAGNAFWRDQKAYAALAKKEFERDRLVFCKGEELLRGLQRVLDVSARRCGKENLPLKLASVCKSEKSGVVALEMEDLKNQREFNLRKLRQKWTESVLRRLACS